MPYTVDLSADTLPFSSQVKTWMEANWRHGPCPVCGKDQWLAEGRVFAVPRLPPDPSLAGYFRSVFPVVCTSCGYTVWINSLVAGLLQSPIPDDLSGLTSEG